VHNPAQDLKVDAQPSFKQDDDQRDSGEDWPYRTKVFRRNKVENRAQEDADDREKQDVRDSGAAEYTGECMRHENEKSYDEDVSGYMHALGQEVISTSSKL
jgi:hypothetical protein